MPGPEDMMGLLQQMLFGVGRYYQLPEIMDYARTLSPRERGQFMRGHLMKALAKHPQSFQLLRSQVTSNDIGSIDWGEHVGTLGIGSLLGLVAHVAAISDVEGYTNFEQIRGMVSPIPPDNIAAIPYVGVKDMKVRLEGEFANRPLDFSLADVMGRVAYRPEMARQLREADTPGRHASKYKHLIDELVEDQLEIPRESLNVRWGEYQTYNGYPIESTGQLEDFLAPIAYGAEAFLHITNDVLEYTQTVKGSHREFHARKMPGARYFIEYGMIDAQIAPEANLTPIYPGGVSKYAKDALSYFWGLFEASPGAPSAEVNLARRRIEALKDIFLYRPREGESDIALAATIQARRGRMTTAEMEDTVSEYAFIPVDHMRPVELWETRAERHSTLFNGVNFVQMHAQISNELQHVKANFATLPLEEQLNIYHLLLLDKILGNVSGLPVGQNNGEEGFRNMIKFASQKGIAIFDWSKIGSRDFDNWVRYAGKVLDTAEVIQMVNKVIEARGGQLTKGERSYKSNPEQVLLMGVRAIEISKAATKVLADSYNQGKFFAFTEDQQALPFTYFWLKGLTRMHCVGKLDDQESRFLMFDYKQFVKSNGLKVAPDGITYDRLVKDWFTDASANIQVAELQEFEKALKEIGCWWVEDESERFLVGPSGRPLFYTATTAELYREAGRSLSEMKQNPNLLGDERNRVDKMVKTHEAITQNGHNRFSMHWLAGRIPFGLYHLSQLYEFMENEGLINGDQKGVLQMNLEKLAKKGLIGAGADHSLCLAPPQYFGPNSLNYHKVTRAI
ncbi:hypothetical protein HYU89_01405 [Candidatus Collierbacteria bacterium]|nr:hypothetical protein [Candidatus Collierbacteria bacterium]